MKGSLKAGIFPGRWLAEKHFICGTYSGYCWFRGRRLSEIFACARGLLFRSVRLGLPNVNLTSDFVHVYPYLFMHFRQ